MELISPDTVLQTDNEEQNVEVVVVSYDDCDLDSDVSTISLQDEESYVYSEDEIATASHVERCDDKVYNEEFVNATTVDVRCQDVGVQEEEEAIHLSNAIVEDEDTMEAVSNVSDNFENLQSKGQIFKIIQFNIDGGIKQDNIDIYDADKESLGGVAMFETDETDEVTKSDAEEMMECTIFSKVQEDGTETEYQTLPESMGVEYVSLPSDQEQVVQYVSLSSDQNQCVQYVPLSRDLLREESGDFQTYIIDTNPQPRSRAQKERRRVRREPREIHLGCLDNEMTVVHPTLRGHRYRRPQPPLQEPHSRTEAAYQCGVCGKSFSRKFSLTAHMSVHDGTSNYKCLLCGKLFIQLCHLKEHLHAHAGQKPNVCDHCGKSFTRLSDLKRHWSTHTSVKQHACYICSKLFSSKHGLEYHLKIHKGHRPWECSLCDKRFVQYGVLTAHMKTHNREKSHVKSHHAQEKSLTREKSREKSLVQDNSHANFLVREESAASHRTRETRPRGRPRAASEHCGREEEVGGREEVVGGMKEETVDEFEVNEIQEEIEI